MQSEINYKINIYESGCIATIKLLLPQLVLSIVEGLGSSFLNSIEHRIQLLSKD